MPALIARTTAQHSHPNRHPTSVLLTAPPPLREPLKALTLHQPWASLIALGAKRIETRNWRPPVALIGQRLAIHAGKKIVKLPSGTYEHYNQAVMRRLGNDWPDTIPTGAVVAIATIQRARQVRSSCDLPDGDEFLFGEYGYLRWMWELSNVTVLDPPVPIRGRQGIWNWHPPELLREPQIGLPTTGTLS